MILLGQATGETIASNPISDLVYDLLPILGVTAAAVLVAFRKRIEQWGNERRDARTADALAPVVEALEDIKRRLPPTPEELEAARTIVQQAEGEHDHE